MPTLDKIKRIVESWSNFVQDEQIELIELNNDFEERYYALKGRIQVLIDQLLETKELPSKMFGFRVNKKETDKATGLKINKMILKIDDFKEK